MFQRSRWVIATALVASLGLPGLSPGATLNVPADYPTIQGCIDAAVSGVDECVVGPGIYHETINFLAKAITLRSSGGADVTTIDAHGDRRERGHVQQRRGGGTVLDGFTITGGTGRYVGGMYNWHSSPTVTNCTFLGNSARYGGGMYNLDSNPTVTNCAFLANSAQYGGGMLNQSNSSSPTVTNCTFSGNTAGYGGGMYNLDSNPTVTNCVLWGNTPAQIAGDGSVSYSDAQGGFSGTGNIDLDPMFVRAPDPGPRPPDIPR